MISRIIPGPAKKYLSRTLHNVRGKGVNGKLVVIESDDWGSIRMPSKSVYDSLQKEGINTPYHYDRLDSLERGKDMEGLLDILQSIESKYQKRPVFTLNTVMGNPDFRSIERDDFSNYYHEPFQDTSQRYYGNGTFDVWENGIADKLICPQFHAREHLNVSLWMKALQNNDTSTRKAFSFGYCGLFTKTPSPFQNHYLAAFHSTGIEDQNQKIEILKEGLKMFSHKFGFQSKTFIPCNYVWFKDLEKASSEANVKLFQGQRSQLLPDRSTGKITAKRRFLGTKNEYGQSYSVRNCFFEPSSSTSISWVDQCLRDISNSFLWNKPAIICSHRVNYIGSIDEKNRSENLKFLNSLLSKIIEKWPEVEFISSPELIEHLN